MFHVKPAFILMEFCERRLELCMGIADLIDEILYPDPVMFYEQGLQE